MNPKVKKGDKVILKCSNNGNKRWEGKILKVVSITKSTGNFTALCEDGNLSARINIYCTSPSDEYVLADRKEQIKAFQENLKEKVSEIKEIEAEIAHLEKYETEEDFVAEKLQMLIKADGPKAMAKILRELKETHYL